MLFIKFSHESTNLQNCELCFFKSPLNWLIISSFRSDLRVAYLIIEGMTYDSCVFTISSKLCKKPGITSITVDLSRYIDLLGMFTKITCCYLLEGLAFSIEPKYDSDFSGIYMNRTQIDSNCSKGKASKPCLGRSTIFAHFLLIFKFYLINFAFNYVSI